MMKMMELFQMIVCSAVLDNPLGRVRSVCQAIDVSSGVPTEILVCPWGTVASTSGEFVVDEVGAAAIVQAHQDKGVDGVIDFHHQTLGGEYSSPDGKAPAAGWIKGYKAIPGRGIVATVQWTVNGENAIRNREFRYLSPVVMVGAEDRRAYAIHSVALTNTPAIQRMEPIVNSDEQVQAAGGVDGAVGDLEAMFPQIEAGTADPGALVALIRKLIDNVKALAGSVGGAMVNSALVERGARGEVMQLRQQNRSLQCEMLVMQHSTKLPPSQKKWFQDYYQIDPQAAREWLVNAPPLVHTKAYLLGGADCQAMPNSDRRAVIVAARSAFRQEVQMLKDSGRHSAAMVCSERAFVNLQLRDGGHDRLTGDETKTFQIVC